MTKKHFEAAAAYVRRNRAMRGADPQLDEAVEDAFCDLFQMFNPRFDEARFRAACRGATVDERRAS
jgi:hypothetical protein